MTNSPLAFENSYAALPDRFHVKMPPTPVAEPKLVKLNERLARELGLDPARLRTQDSIEMFAGNQVPSGSIPLAMAYAGHQFGNWVPQLGDGRAILLGEIRGLDGRLFDIQLKGSGRTPFSRLGDGRAVLGPVLREYIVSEAMHGLGIPSTRALAAVTTGEPVVREAVLPGAVLTRVARAHVRVGTFQYFAARGDVDGLRTLADYVIERCYPYLGDTDNRYRSLLDAVVAVQAELVAQWLGVGFIHGVMNTDNMSIAGETIDFGPCAFMDDYHPLRVFSSIDEGGRYAYSRQPDIAQWNLACLARAILPLLGDDEDAAIQSGQTAIDAFPDIFGKSWHRIMAAKLGFEDAQEVEIELVHNLLKLMAEREVDYTNFFRDLSEQPLELQALDEHFATDPAFGSWWERWQQCLGRANRDEDELRERLCQANPAVIPRNHRIEQAIVAAHAGDLSVFENLLQALERPFEGRVEQAEFRAPPRPEEVVHQTFCGT